MATGTVTPFEEFAHEIGDKLHSFGADTFKLGIINNTLVPTAADLTPRWADYSANEVSAAGGYVAGGITLTGATPWQEVGGVSTFKADDVTLAQNALGFTDGYWGIIYNFTSLGKEAVAYVEMGGPVSEQAGPITFAWNAAGVFTVTA